MNGATIGPTHPLYQLALLATRDRYRRPARAQEIAAALAPAWPRQAGERPVSEHVALTAAALAADGLDTGEVADAMGVQLDTARRRIKRGRELHAPGRDFAPYVEAVGTETQPAALTLAQSWARPEQAAARLAEHELRTGKRERI